MSVKLASLFNNFISEKVIPARLKWWMKNDGKGRLGKRRVIARSGTIVGKQGVLYQVRTDMGIELIPRFKIHAL